MNIYLRKILKHDITHQISVTKEILNGFFGVYNEKASTQVKGRKSGYTGTVTFLLSTDPRFGGEIKQIINNEGGMEEDDILLFAKAKNGYVLEIITKDNSMHDTFLSIMSEERHLIINIDDADGLVQSLDYSVYGMHIKLQNDALSDTKPHICIGWSKIGDMSDITTKEELDARYESAYPNEKVRKKAQDLGQIWRFIKEMQIGDYVVFSNGDTCHIGCILSDYYYNNAQNANQNPDYVNVRDVEWLKKDISKSDLSEVFQNSLGAAMSVFRLNDYKSAVKDILNDAYVKDELCINDYENLEEQFKNWLLKRTTRKGDLWVIGSVNNCLNKLRKGFVKFGGYQDYTEFFEISEIEAFEEYLVYLNYQSGVKEFDDSENRWFSKGLVEYKEFLLSLDERETESLLYAPMRGNATNKIYFGVPGCGKSYHIAHEILASYEKDNIIRTTFYQDYSNTDFVGQILPKITKNEEGKDIVEYIFNPGPFTLALIQAISNPTKKVALVVEEINRGNAPAIFGDIFQLLDRDEHAISEYGIINVGVLDYLNDYEFTIEGKKVKYKFKEIKIPGNLDIFATMNTSDQNVYTLDTAFTRRWEKERIPNEFKGHAIETMLIPGLPNCTWGKFVVEVNNHIKNNLETLQVNEDKQVGVFFIKERDLLTKDEIATDKKIEAFAFKVLEYLWDDVSKLDHSVIFNPIYKTFEGLVKGFIKNGAAVFNDIIKVALETKTEQTN